jgi:hypothetical protein
MHLLVGTLLLTLATPACGQADAARRAEVIQRLTAGTAKEWVFTRWVKHMGAEERCDQGESLVFAANGTVESRRCVNHSVQPTQQRWRLEFPTSIDVVIVIDNIRYFLILPPETNVGSSSLPIEKMTLRQRSQSITQPTIDRNYVHVGRRTRR